MKAFYHWRVVSYDLDFFTSVFRWGQQRMMICELVVVLEGLMLPMLESAIQWLHVDPAVTTILRKSFLAQLKLVLWGDRQKGGGLPQTW